jgi:hypothetical protein
MPSQMGHSRPGPAGRRSSHVRYAPKATVGHQNAIGRDGPATDIASASIPNSLEQRSKWRCRPAASLRANEFASVASRRSGYGRIKSRERQRSLSAPAPFQCKLTKLGWPQNQSPPSSASRRDSRPLPLLRSTGTSHGQCPVSLRQQ